MNKELGERLVHAGSQAEQQRILDKIAALSVVSRAIEALNQPSTEDILRELGRPEQPRPPIRPNQTNYYF